MSDGGDPNFWAYIHAAQAGPILFKRVSFRLVFLGTICDLCHAIAWILSVVPTSEADNKLCIGSMFAMNLFLLGSLFGTASIGMNLLLVFVLKLPPGLPYEKVYYSVSVFLALLLPIIALSSGWFGWDGTECWYDSSGGDNAVFVHKWTTNYGWILLVSVFCLICTMLFHVSFYRRRNVIATNKDKHADSMVKSGDQAFSKTEKLIARVVGRIRWYCLVPILAHTCSLACDVLQYQGQFSSPLLISANFLSGSMGFLNSTIFLTLDPSFETARGQLRAYLVFQYYLRHFTVVPSTAAAANKSTKSSNHKSSSPSPVDGTHTVSAKCADAEAGMAEFVLKPRGIVPTGLAYHAVRLLLLRQKDIQLLMETTRRETPGTGKRKSMSANHMKQKLAAADRASFEALEESDLSGAAAERAAEEMNRL
ncbi:hypothetical protein HDU87_003561 [Geranomyces variabilis]|uniref:G-protein coupled receptors family 2 profile 2 domain-containing protein n=1 Tax=Geranomyces variabilis TaxID=109894 RepID=A0AAD5XMH1_9FUNG|nr:hypothetical protein HDU87_003561 [Geranomyces variabilis]